MNPYLVALLIIAIIVFSNLIMFAAVRGLSGVKVEWHKMTKTAFGQPYQKEEKQLNELRQRVDNLNAPPDKLDK